MSCAALSAIVPGDPRREPFDLDEPCALQREAGGRARQGKRTRLRGIMALGNQPTGKKREREKARRCRRPARALPGMMRAPWTASRRGRTPIRLRRCRGGGQTRDAFVRTPGPRRPSPSSTPPFPNRKKTKPKAKCRVVQHRSRAETPPSRGSPGRAETTHRRIVSNAMSGRRAQRTEGSDTVARASPRSPPRSAPR